MLLPGPPQRRQLAGPLLVREPALGLAALGPALVPGSGGGSGGRLWLLRKGWHGARCGWVSIGLQS